MKAYGFHPFIRTAVKEENGVVYDLLSGNVFKIDPKIIQLFNDNVFLDVGILREKAEALSIKEDQFTNIISDGIRQGIIVESKHNALRGEVISPLEFKFMNESLYYSLRTLAIKPTGLCNIRCPECDEYMNCCCNTGGGEWDKNEVENFVEDLQRYSDSIANIQIYGGNLLQFRYLDMIINGILRTRPGLAEIRLPLLELFSEKMNYLKEHYSSKVRFSYFAFPSMLESLKKLKSTEEAFAVYACLENDQKEEISKYAREKMPNSRLILKYMLKKDLSNIQWFKSAIKNGRMKGVTFYDFAHRKYFQKCWGLSFSIDQKGIIRPCLWSDKAFGEWENGEYFNTIIKNNLCENYWLDNALEKRAGCVDCIYRYCCQHCAVITGHLLDRKSGNPYCIYSPPDPD